MRKTVTVNVSSRHFHCRRETFEALFGKGATPTNLRDLIQPGQFACKETVTLKGPKGEIPKVRLIAPFRDHDQVELARTDAVKLGIKAPVRDSGDVKGSAPITLVGPAGEVRLGEGAIVQRRHIHFSPKAAAEFGIKDKEYVWLRLHEGQPAETTFKVLCRVRGDMDLECHLDTDEANAAGIEGGTEAVVLIGDPCAD